VHLHPLDFAFQFFAEQFSCAESDTEVDVAGVSLFSTERNMTTRVGVPQVDTRQICPTTLD